MDNFGLSQRTINEIKTYFENKSEIEKAVIFGSRAKGNYTTGSDIDFALWTNGNISQILSDLEDLPTPYKFDIVDYKNLTNEKLKNNIDNNGILFYKKL